MAGGASVGRRVQTSPEADNKQYGVEVRTRAKMAASICTERME